MSLIVYPTVEISKALGITAAYRIGGPTPGAGNQVQLGSASYLIGTAPGTYIPISTGHWLMWSVYAQTPWGGIFYGKRPMNLGCGLQFDGATNRSTEWFTLAADTGPFRIGLGFLPWRDNGLDYPDYRTANRLYWNTSDNNRSVNYNVLGFVTYFSGPLEIGVGTIQASFAQGPESQLTGANRQNFPRTDTDVSEGLIYTKYNNGRFFLNAEADWYYRTDRYQRSLNNTFFGTAAIPVAGGGSLFAPKYVESWRYMVEGGVICGPSKLSLLYSFLPGPDRRHGILIDKQPHIQLADQGNGSVFGPYSGLMSGIYAAGVNALDNNGSGFMSDARVLAARLDYALAANVNLFGSFFWAKRYSDGYGLGFIAPVNTLGLTPAIDGTVRYARQGTFAAPANTIPDKDLGWEIGLGLNWALLERWNLDMRGYFWQPGKWYNYACIDRAVANWDVPAAGNWWGVNPSRSIDPVYSFNTTLSASF